MDLQTTAAAAVTFSASAAPRAGEQSGKGSCAVET